MELKLCKYCSTILPASQFSPHPHTKDRRSNKCKTCVAAYNRDRWKRLSPEEKQARVEQNRRLRERRATAYRDANRCKAFRRKYGVTLAEYHQQWQRQDCRCAICDRPRSDDELAFAIDHCHATGSVRGILCPQCNVDLGRIERYLAKPELIDAYLSCPPWNSQPHD